MKTDHLVIEQDDEMLKQRRPWYYVALALLLVSVLARQPIVFLASLFTLLVGLVPDLWYRQGLKRLLVRQQISQQHLFFGEEVTLSISIENRKLLPLPWLGVEDKITPPLTLLKKRSRLQAVNRDTITSTWLLWSFQRVTRRYQLRCQTRGLHVFGPIRLSNSDPFGWLESETTLPIYTPLLIYPPIVPIETLSLTSVLPSGERATLWHLLEDPLQVVGTRAYVPGDDPRRIHWKATAHAGTLYSKVYEPSSLRRLLVLLDVWNYSETLQGTDTEIQELTISIAASLALWGLDNSYTVGLLTNCAMMQTEQTTSETPTQRPSSSTTPFVNMPFAADDGQYERLLSTFACLLPSIHSSIDILVDTENTMFSAGTTLLLVSAISTLSESTLERLYELRTRGVAAHLILTGDPATLTLADAGNFPLYFPGGKEKWHAIINAIGSEHGTDPGTSAITLQLD